MSRALVIGIATIILLAIIAFASARRRGAAPSAVGTTSGQGVLRDAILSRALFSDLPADTSGKVRCALMDWNLGTGVATLVAFDDGTVSLYLSTGGGVIGAGEHQRVRAAAEEFRQAVAVVRPKLKPTASYAMPGPDSVTFWAVTRNETYSSGPVAVSQVQDGTFWLAQAGNAAQVTIARIQETKH